MKIHRLEHVGIVVNDLDAATAFFVDLGLEVEGEADVEGDWVDKVIGLKNVKARVVQLGTPTGQAKIELSRFHTPVDEEGPRRPASNTLGIRHILFVVEDIDAIVAKMKAKGTEFFSEVHHYEGGYKVCYLRGPEGIILELAEQVR